MKKRNIFQKNYKIAPNRNYFTGKVKMKDLSENTKESWQKVFHVIFENGSRTKLHYHTGSQTLIVTEGKGSLITYQKKSKKCIKRQSTIPLKKGDLITIPSKVLHTHGSTDNKKIFSHLAINNYTAKGKKPKTVWYESDFEKEIFFQIT